MVYLVTFRTRPNFMSRTYFSTQLSQSYIWVHLTSLFRGFESFEVFKTFRRYFTGYLTPHPFYFSMHKGSWFMAKAPTV